MFKIKKKFLFLIFPAFFIFTIFLSPPRLDARGFRGGFRSSFGRSSSWGRSSRSSFFRPSSRSRWGSGRSSSSGLFSGRRSSTRRTLSAADQKLAAKAKSSGTYFNSRQTAVKQFTNKFGSKYTSKYKTKPSTRPTYIPSSTTVNGKKYQVSYNPTYGGYGYMNNGKWRFYEVARDAAMISLLMRRNNYYYEPSGYYGYHRESNWFGTIIIFVFIGIAIYLWFISQRQNSDGRNEW